MMKIIGERDDGFIVDIDRDELKKLTGHYYDDFTFRIGQELQVGKIFNQLRELGSQESNIKKTVHTVKTAAGMLEKINPIFHKEDE